MQRQRMKECGRFLGNLGWFAKILLLKWPSHSNIMESDHVMSTLELDDEKFDVNQTCFLSNINIKLSISFVNFVRSAQFIIVRVGRKGQQSCDLSDQLMTMTMQKRLRHYIKFGRKENTDDLHFFYCGRRQHTVCSLRTIPV
jgi:hypothetical protein